jgi:hypothetical protein
MRTVLFIFLALTLALTSCGGGGVDCEAGDPQWGSHSKQWQDECKPQKD